MIVSYPVGFLAPEAHIFVFEWVKVRRGEKVRLLESLMVVVTGQECGVSDLAVDIGMESTEMPVTRDRTSVKPEILHSSFRPAPTPAEITRTRIFTSQHEGSQ